MGLLDQLDPSILAMLNPQMPDDVRHKINMDALLTAGLGMMQNANMKPVQAIGYGGLLGQRAKNESITDYYRQRSANMAGVGQAVNLQGQLQGLQDQSDLRKAETGFAQQYGAPGAQQPQPQMAPPQMAPPSVAPPTAPPLNTSLSPAQLAIAQRDAQKNGYGQVQIPGGDTGRQMVNVADMSPPAPVTLPQAATGAPTTAPAKAQKFEQYQQMGDYWMQNSKGNPLILAKAQQYYDLAEKYRPKLKETKTLTQGGQRVTVNLYDDGSTQVLPLGPDLEKAHFADTGNAVQPVNPYTGAPQGAAMPKTQTPDSAASLAETKRYHDLEMGIGPNGEQTNYDKVAEAIANYSQAPMSSFAMGKPIGAAIMSKVMELNPSYDAKNFAAAQQTLTAFSKGPEAQKVRSFNVALSHLDTLGQLTDALQNGNIPLINKLGNAVSQQTGSPAVTNFSAAKQIVANEIVKAIVGSGGGVEDRAKAQATIAAANSPAQLKGVIDTYKQLMGGQLGGLKQQYETGARRDDFDRMLSPEAQRYLKGPASPDIRQRADKILAGQ